MRLEYWFTGPGETGSILLSYIYAKEKVITDSVVGEDYAVRLAKVEIALNRYDSQSKAWELFSPAVDPDRIGNWDEPGKDLVSHSADSITYSEVFRATPDPVYAPISHKVTRLTCYHNYVIEVTAYEAGAAAAQQLIDYAEYDAKLVAQDKGFVAAGPTKLPDLPVKPGSPSSPAITNGPTPAEGKSLWDTLFGEWPSQSNADGSAPAIPAGQAAAAGAVGGGTVILTTILLNLFGGTAAASGAAAAAGAAAASSAAGVEAGNTAIDGVIGGAEAVDATVEGPSVDAVPPELRPPLEIAEVNVPEDPGEGVMIADQGGRILWDLIKKGLESKPPESRPSWLTETMRNEEVWETFWR